MDMIAVSRLGHGGGGRHVRGRKERNGEGLSDAYDVPNGPTLVALLSLMEENYLINEALRSRPGHWSASATRPMYLWYSSSNGARFWALPFVRGTGATNCASDHFVNSGCPSDMWLEHGGGIESACRFFRVVDRKKARGAGYRRLFTSIRVSAATSAFMAGHMGFRGRRIGHPGSSGGSFITCSKTTKKIYFSTSTWSDQLHKRFDSIFPFFRGVPRDVRMDFG